MNLSEAQGAAPGCVWLTGASSGIGLALAEVLASSGSLVIVTARSAAKLEALAARFPDRIFAAPADLSSAEGVAPLAARLEAILEAQQVDLDTVILNAGDCEYLEDGHCDSALFQRIVNLNVMGVVRCIEIAEPYLRDGAFPQERPATTGERGNGMDSPARRLVIVSSLVTRLALPRAAAYGASKAALDYLAASLRLDWADDNCRIVRVSPGFVATPLTAQNTFAMPFLMNVEQAARAIVRGLAGEKRNIVFPWQLAAVLRLAGWLPESLRLWLARRQLREVKRTRAEGKGGSA